MAKKMGTVLLCKENLLEVFKSVLGYNYELKPMNRTMFKLKRQAI